MGARELGVVSGAALVLLVVVFVLGRGSSSAPSPVASVDAVRVVSAVVLG